MSAGVDPAMYYGRAHSRATEINRKVTHLMGLYKVENI
jgi:hypothetical protein